MGSLLVIDGDQRRLIPLASVTLVGRGVSCLARLTHPSCPAHWLEIRWTGTIWAWRCLAGAERTRGSGHALPDGWMALLVEEHRGARVSLGTAAHVELIDGGPPEPFAWDVVAGVPLEGAELETVAEVRGDHLLPLSAEGDARQALGDGDCWVHQGPDGPRTLRAHVPTHFAPTSAPRIDLARGEVFVLVDLAELRATFRQGQITCLVQGACVRTLVVYGNARDHGDGWLTAAEAWAAWTELGPTEDRPLLAVGWERARLRRRLDRVGVGGLEVLFETRKEGAFQRTRIGPGIEVDVLG
jgi:hypothetical protein